MGRDETCSAPCILFFKCQASVKHAQWSKAFQQSDSMRLLDLSFLVDKTKDPQEDLPYEQWSSHLRTVLSGNPEGLKMALDAIDDLNAEGLNLSELSERIYSVGVERNRLYEAKRNAERQFIQAVNEQGCSGKSYRRRSPFFRRKEVCNAPVSDSLKVSLTA